MICDTGEMGLRLLEAWYLFKTRIEIRTAQLHRFNLNYIHGHRLVGDNKIAEHNKVIVIPIFYIYLS